MPGEGPLLRCRHCDQITREPLTHLADTHVRRADPPTLADVWTDFAVVGASRPCRPERVPDTPQEETLF